MPMPNELRVFISSTFRDLQEEREHLIKRIFPEIRTLCRSHGIVFTEVDLRWGLTDEDVALGQVIRTCLEEVDKCRPYFIGITGDRYGFVPTHLDIYKDPALLEQYPWIEEAAMDQMSITEMEAHYGVLSPPTPSSIESNGSTSSVDPVARNRSRFYFRRHRASLDDAGEETEERRRLDAYQQRIRESGAHVSEFRDPVSLGELVYDDLIEIIRSDFSDAQPPTPLEEERSRHEAFSLSRRRAYIPNPDYLKRLNDHASADGPPLVVYAESGSGKSSLFAYWADQHRRRNPNAHVIEHYVGIGATSTDHYGVIRHVCMEINERFGRDEEIPSEPAKLELALGQWLGYADHELNRRGEQMVLILDGLNQLQGEALKLRWIPDTIAPSIRMILSSTVEGTLVELQKRGWSRLGMQALSEAERETIVVRYLAEYHKSLNPEQIRRIAGDYKCGHPLFLKTLLEELRLVGRHEDLDRMIDRYLEATGTEDLFQRVLERLEEDYNLRAVRDVMSLLSAARSGLDERELSELSGLARLKIAAMIAGLDYHLVRKEGRLTFFHDYLRRAVEKRYMSDETTKRTTHRHIADYFEMNIGASIAGKTSVSVRTAGELVYQLHAAGATDRLKESLSTMPVFLLLYSDETQYEVLRYWSAMAEGGDVEESYRRGLERWETDDPKERSAGTGRVVELLRQLSSWTGAIDLERERLAASIARGDRAEEASSRESLGRLLHLRAGYVESLEESARALELYTDLEDRGGVARAFGNMGMVYSLRGEYDRANECYERQLQISEELGDRRGMAHAIGRMGVVYSNRGEYDRALEYYNRSLILSEALGDRGDIANAVGSMGVVYTIRGEYDLALECYAQQLQISEELGDRRGMAHAIGNTGLVYYNRGEYDRAQESFERLVRICEELDDRHGLAAAFSNMGQVYLARRDHDRALENFERGLRLSKDLGNPAGIASTLGNTATIYASRGEYDRALETYEQALRLHRELGDRRGIGVVLVNVADIYESRGEYERALEYFVDATAELREIGLRAGLCPGLVGIARVLVDLVQAGDIMPDHLPTTLPNVTAEGWKATAIQKARVSAEEGVAISAELKMSNTKFDGQVVLARIIAVAGDIDAATERLQEMLAEATDAEQQAELHYRLWKLHATDIDHRTESLRLYESLIEKTPEHVYRRRIEELKRAGERATSSADGTRSE